MSNTTESLNFPFPDFILNKEIVIEYVSFRIVHQVFIDIKLYSIITIHDIIMAIKTKNIISILLSERNINI